MKTSCGDGGDGRRRADDWRFIGPRTGVKHGFQLVAADEAKVILASPRPSTYFMKADRDGLAIGLAARNLVMSFPWFLDPTADTPL